MPMNVERVKMRMNNAAKAWNDFFTEFEQVYMEGYNTQEMQDELRRLKARCKAMNKISDKIRKLK